MRARACIAILLAGVIHSGDGSSLSAVGSDIVDPNPLTGVQLGTHADREFAVRRLVQRAVWVDRATSSAAHPGGLCVETRDVCTDCGQGVAAIDRLDSCDRANRRIAF